MTQKEQTQHENTFSVALGAKATLLGVGWGTEKYMRHNNTHVPASTNFGLCVL